MKVIRDNQEEVEIAVKWPALRYIRDIDMLNYALRDRYADFHGKSKKQLRQAYDNLLNTAFLHSSSCEYPDVETTVHIRLSPGDLETAYIIEGTGNDGGLYDWEEIEEGDKRVTDCLQMLDGRRTDFIKDRAQFYGYMLNNVGMRDYPYEEEEDDFPKHEPEDDNEPNILQDGLQAYKTKSIPDYAKVCDGIPIYTLEEYKNLS